MKLYEIINPSDPYTLKAEEEVVAAAAVSLLGRWSYGLRDLSTHRIVFGPMWGPVQFTKQFDIPFSEIIKRREEIATVLDSVEIGDETERWLVDKALEFMFTPSDRGSFLNLWRDKRRSSMTDIGKSARKLAAEIRLGTPNPEDKIPSPTIFFS